MRQKRLALINDFTGYSRCSLAAVLPIVSAMKIEGVMIPTAVLSINTYFKNYYFDDYTEKMPEYIQTYKELNLEFDGICSGFLGSAKQVDILIDFIKYFKNNDTFVLIDPVMGDHGKLYPTYDEKMQAKMRQLIPYATIMTPNLTELCALLELAYPSEVPSNEELYEMCLTLASQGPKYIVVTGLSRNDDEIENFIYDNGHYSVVIVKRIGSDRSGTGDVIAAVIAGAYCNGSSFQESVKKATEFTGKCIQFSVDINAHPHRGLCFEQFLCEL